MSIILNDDLIIGEGRDRVCYMHPFDPGLCIKIPKRFEKQTRRERLYFSILKLLKKNTEHLSNYKGMIETNIGRGAIFDLVRDNNQNISLTLTESIKCQTILKSELDSLLLQLFNYLNTNAICIRDLSPNNIAVQILPTRKKLIIIDGVSNPGINPLFFFIPQKIRLDIKKRWISLEKKINQTFATISEKNND